MSSKQHFVFKTMKARRTADRA